MSDPNFYQTVKVGDEVYCGDAHYGGVPLVYKVIEINGNEYHLLDTVNGHTVFIPDDPTQIKPIK
jgi:hypothetical protein